MLPIESDPVATLGALIDEQIESGVARHGSGPDAEAVARSIRTSGVPGWARSLVRCIPNLKPEAIRAFVDDLMRVHVDYYARAAALRRQMETAIGQSPMDTESLARAEEEQAANTQTWHAAVARTTDHFAERYLTEEQRLRYFALAPSESRPWRTADQPK
ncbi:MAG: hypothetical protein L0216_09550 [Planctomycetales bacterium]|nr:hypothetical protein [Planctomycetales bacterium]